MKKLIIGILTFAIAFATLTSMTACDKIVKLEISLTVYNTETSATENRTLTFDMYENLAKSAVDAVRDSVLSGAYNDCVFYKQDYDRGTGISSQLMFGGLKKNGNTYVKTNMPSVPDAEFEKNGVQGSNLKSLKGYLGLWRSWDSWKDYKTSGFTTSTASMYIPTSDISSYDGNFCVFAKYASDDDLAVIDDIITLFDSDSHYTQYTCYYSAEADGTLAEDADGNPVWNIVLTSDFEDADNVYDSADDPDMDSKNVDTQYDSYTVKIVSASKLNVTEIKVK